MPWVWSMRGIMPFWSFGDKGKKSGNSKA